MAERQHPVRAKLAAGEPVLAAALVTSNLELAALIATLGFDFLWVEMEHSPVTLESLRTSFLLRGEARRRYLLAFRSSRCGPPSAISIRGVSGLIFPFTSSPAHARRAAQA